VISGFLGALLLGCLVPAKTGAEFVTAITLHFAVEHNPGDVALTENVIVFDASPKEELYFALRVALPPAVAISGGHSFAKWHGYSYCGLPAGGKIFSSESVVPIRLDDIWKFTRPQEASRCIYPAIFGWRLAEVFDANRYEPIIDRRDGFINIDVGTKLPLGGIFGDAVGFSGHGDGIQSRLSAFFSLNSRLFRPSGCIKGRRQSEAPHQCAERPENPGGKRRGLSRIGGLPLGAKIGGALIVALIAWIIMLRGFVGLLEGRGYLLKGALYILAGCLGWLFSSLFWWWSGA